MRYNSKGKENIKDKYSSFFISSFDGNRFNPLDRMPVDSISRITLTRNIKKAFPVSPSDTILVFEDKYTKNLILKIEQKGQVIDTWMLFKIKNDNNCSKNFLDKDRSVYYHDDEGDDNGRKEDNHNSEIEIKDTINKNKNRKDIPIVLVDDEQDLLKVFELFLSSEGYTNIQTFSDSKKVVRYFASLKDSSFPALAIVDIRMPKINGIQLYQILKILNPSVKVLFITAWDGIQELISIYPQINSTDIIRKPVDQNEFIKIVKAKISEI